MIDCLELRSRILFILNNSIGTYRFEDGSTTAAIAILPDETYGWNYPNGGTATSGIEVIIHRPYPSVSSLLNSQILKNYRWLITLKQWDVTSSLLDPSYALIGNLDYSITTPRLVPPNPALGIIEQVRFEILDYDLQQVEQVNG